MIYGWVGVLPTQPYFFEKIQRNFSEISSFGIFQYIAVKGNGFVPKDRRWMICK